MAAPASRPCSGNVPVMLALILCVTLVGGTGAASSQVTRVFPADGSTAPAGAAVGAELNFAAGPAVDVKSLRLLLDGQDVTSRATTTMTRDWPPSHVSISYAPGALKPGPHRAEIRFRPERGPDVVYRWQFAVP